MFRFKIILAVMCVGLLAACGAAGSEPLASGSAPGRTDSTQAQEVVVRFAGTAVVSPTSLNFGEQRVGTTSAPQTVTVSNSGSSPLQVTGISITSSASFVVTPSSPFTLSPGTTNALTVMFSPTVEGTASGTLTLTTNDPAYSTITVDLSGRGVKPNPVLNPISLAFGDVRVGTNVTKTVTVANTGSGPITLTSLSLSGSGSSAFSLVSPPLVPFTVEAGSSQTFTVTFSPTAEGVVSGTLSLTTNDPDWLNLAVALSGTGVKPNLVVSPTSLAFGEQLVGSTSTPQMVTVRNAGSGLVRITGIAVTAGKPFAVSSSTPFDLMAGESKDLFVTFSPTAKGNVTATLTLSTDDASSSTVSISLMGTGVTSLEMSPVSVLDFGEVPTGTTVTRTVTLSNSSAAPIQLTSVSVSAPFTVSGLIPPVTLAARASLSFNVGFSPSTTGPFNAVLTVQSDATNGPHTLVLTGTGTVPEARLSLPASDGAPISTLDFGGVRVGASKQLTVRLTNTGNGPLVLAETPAVTGGAFTYLGQSSVTLSPGAYFDFPVSFSPTSNANYTGTLTLKSNAVNSPTVLSLTGFGAVPQLAVDRTAISFGDVRVGSQSVAVPITLANTGNGDVTLQSLSVSGPFSLLLPSGASLPRTIRVGAPFTFEVIFKPTVQGAVAGSITLISDADSSPMKVALEGNGTVAQAALNVASLDFGAQRVMTASSAQPVIITNTGSADLAISQFISSNSAFSISSPLPLPTESAPLVIPGGQQKALFVVFTPRTQGLVEGKLYIVSNSASAVEPLSLTGKGIDGRMSLTPAVVSFPSVEVGSSGTKMSVMLTNVGEAPLTLTGVSPPADAAFRLSGLTEGTVLQPGEGQAFTVAFSPVTRGYVSASAVIKSDAVITPSINLSMEGTGVAAAVDVLPKELVFGQSNVGASITRDIAIKNVGEKDLYVSNITFEDAATGAALDFSVGGSVVFPLMVAPGASSTVSLKFSPRQVGLRQARALVYTNDRTAEVSLQGEGTSPSLRLSASMLDFGKVLVGNPSAPLALKLSNTGTGPLTLTAMRLSGADVASFILSVPTLPVTLSPGASTEVFVAMRPDAERSFSAQLLVDSNDASAPSAAVPLSGMGIRQQQVQLSASSLEFGHQLTNSTSLPRKLRVINNSDSNATLTALTVQGSGASRFSVVAPALPLVLAPGQEQEVAVTFSPVSEAETSCTLKLSFIEQSQPLEVTLHGQGIASVLAVNPSPVDFGAVRVGGSKREQPLTITNLSGDPIVLAAVETTYSTGEPFQIDTDSVQGRTLEPGMSLIVPVSYQPMVESLSETTLSFGTTTPARPRAAEVQLKGWATTRFLTVDSESLDFGRVDVDVPVEPKPVTVTNRSSQTQRVVVKLRDAEATPFSVQTSALSEPLAPGATATFKVAFQPHTAGDSGNEVQVWLQGATEPEAVIPVTGSAFSSTEESAGCSCGTTDVGSSGLLALLVMAGLGSQRRRRA